jgi:phosphohistidine phosphatase
MLTSRAKRALQTAKLVAEELGYRRDDLAIDDSLYLAAPERILAVVAKQDDGVESLLLVGHNPGLTNLVNHLVPELGIDNLPTTGVVAVDFDVERWRNVASAAAKLAFYDYPANPESVRTES